MSGKCAVTEDKILLREASVYQLRQLGKENGNLVAKGTVKRATAFFEDFNIEGTMAGVLSCGRLLLKSGRLDIIVGKSNEEDAVWYIDTQ